MICLRRAAAKRGRPLSIPKFSALRHSWAVGPKHPRYVGISAAGTHGRRGEGPGTPPGARVHVCPPPKSLISRKRIDSEKRYDDEKLELLDVAWELGGEAGSQHLSPILMKNPDYLLGERNEKLLYRCLIMI